MSRFFEITKDQISQLNDGDFRDLIALLCEADYRKYDLSTTGILWGGDQNAADGGLDVVVNQKIEPPQNSFIPRKFTGFQVKAEDFPPGKILSEMKPNGELRSEIKNLIENSGSYIIASSKGTTSNTYIKKRIAKMRDAVQNESNHDDLFLDFYDPNRVATWVRNHPSLIHWVHNKIGVGYSGWRPYENWAHPKGGITEKYIVDEEKKFLERTSKENNEISVLEGLAKIRHILNFPGNSVRLVGLSGVGKTRFVQALFDKRIGQDSLNPYLVHYSDVSDDPSPKPNELIEILSNDKTRAIIILDNCPSDLHKTITEKCSVPNCTVSAISIEYDIRDDIPEDTEVFLLKSSSEHMIRDLIKLRYPNINDANAWKIAEFSSGNARLGLSLANTVHQGESLTSFKDEDLFQRLFWQRNQPDGDLLHTAMICSLVFSFNGDYPEKDDSEMPFLANFAEQSILKMYGNIEELNKRDLIQKRGVWRALLPHALANRLAIEAITKIPKAIVIDYFENKGTNRLLKSFAHRLSFLHNSETAKDIADKCLEPDGIIGKNIKNLNNIQISILEFLAPVSPSKTLELLEYAAKNLGGMFYNSDINKHYYELFDLLRKLSYDPELFDSSVRLMCELTINNYKKRIYKDKYYFNELHNLFHLYLSGSKATINQRVVVIEELLSSSDNSRRELGQSLLNAALKARDFSTAFFPEFGARQRDQGYYPKNDQDVKNWYESLFDVCKSYISENERIGHILADRIGELWPIDQIRSNLVNTALELNKENSWTDGWLAIIKVIQYDIEKMDGNQRKDIKFLEKELRPHTLYDQSKAIVFNSNFPRLIQTRKNNLDNEVIALLDDLGKTARYLGREVSRDFETFNKLKIYMVTMPGRLSHQFGIGLAEGSQSKYECFVNLINEIKNINEQKQSIHVLRGFLSEIAAVDKELCNQLLDITFNDKQLEKFYPDLQISSLIDEYTVNRIKRSLEKGLISANSYLVLNRKIVHKRIDITDLVNILEMILRKENGLFVCSQIVEMKIIYILDEGKEIPGNLAEFAQKLIPPYLDQIKENNLSAIEHIIGDIIQWTLQSPENEAFTREILRQICNNLENNFFDLSGTRDILKNIAIIQPYAFLDEFLQKIQLNTYEKKSIFYLDLFPETSLVNKISDEILLAWGKVNPNTRFPLIASTMYTFSESKTDNSVSWRPIIYKFLEFTPNKADLLEALYDSLIPISWSGQRSHILKRRRLLLEDLLLINEENVKEWIGRKLFEYDNLISSEINQEKLHNTREERFE